jgi:acetoacetyl-CoA synthetase
MDVHAWDESQRPVKNEKGELVCATPFPCQPVCFWNDPDGAKYRGAYFDYYADAAQNPDHQGEADPRPDRQGGRDRNPDRPGAADPRPDRQGGRDRNPDRPGGVVWRHGDFIEITDTGGIIVYGRSDATLNPGGVRIGTAEIYRVVEGITEIIDSIVVGRDTPDQDVEVCLFVVLRPGATLDAALEKRIREAIAAGATKRHVPRHIKQVRAIPYTISGKKVELAVRRMIHGQDVPNRDALANPDALEEYRGLV